MSMKEFFLKQIPKNNAWPIYPDAIQGFSEDELQRYCDALNIEAHGELREFLLTFGRCSGGIFSVSPFVLYNYTEQFSTLEKVANWHQEYIDYLVGDGHITADDTKKKPYIFYDHPDGIVAFVYSTDPNLTVWEMNSNTEQLQPHRLRLDSLAKQVKALKKEAPDLFPYEQITSVAQTHSSVSNLSMFKAVLLEEKYLSEFYRNLHLKTREDILKISTCHFM